VEDGVVATHTERFILTKFTPFLLKNKVKSLILVLYAIVTGISIYGCIKIDNYYNDQLNLEKNSAMYDFY